ncbi:GNAT family N-acetyltransferase [Sulfitobacter aestuariivivens]|uniref:GNAT family N-acetyltransferase n=1 Tax=Sulfitobacter aestuariivivens TaxID=2766981 RepID=A0A927D382_9RHOB|nr:GNAT family N-acetyltransferase [Sulfitobacter aestuariivivens]MBD3664263.1 GNAT family N-acetyltransferase [Sulfitobacter aestuariivivens]
MTTTEIRPTTSDDIPGLTVVLEDTQLFPPDMLPDMLAAPEGGFWLTAARAGDPVALSFTRPEPLAEGVWNMLALGVRADLQRQGVGASLVAVTEARLRGDGVRLLIVETSGTQDFAQARGFYAGLGYHEEARIRDYWAAGDDKVIFCKVL